MRSPRYYGEHAHTATTRGGNLPHWAQGCATFATFRLADSLPKERLLAFNEERSLWMESHPEPWDESTADEYRELFPKRFHAWLDAGHGSCILREDRMRKIVETSLCHFADKRYSLYAYVVMPNHVHVLYMPDEGFDGREIVRGWKQYTAHEINKVLGKEGAVWQKESYDHLVRNVSEFTACRVYIRKNNPALAFDAFASAESS